ncbi:autotransporter outer membrane beta-barrel domain-containing protein [Brevundimonas sp. NPDC092305]|uniref:autotransporter outer membrane beta-barrel domain-containing protein n=1 Tax=Brevundimonas sp. NPDC092305 TaxID=3363957 RepID=UPI00382E54C9
MRNSGAQTVESTTITTEGMNAHGIDLSGSRESVNVTSGSIKTNGELSSGIRVRDTVGPITINSTTIDVEGRYSDGITIDVAGGPAAPITVNGGSVRVTGEQSYGISIEATGATAVEVTGSVSTVGDRSTGLFIRNDGRTHADMGIVSVDGDGSLGIQVSNDAAAGSAVDIHVASLRILGDNSLGADIEGDSVKLDLDDLQISGDDSIGVSLDLGDARTVDLTIDNANVTGEDSALATVYAAETIKADFGRIRIAEGADPTVLLSAQDVTATVRDFESASQQAGGVVIEAGNTAGLKIGRLVTAGNAEGDDRAAATITAGGAVVVEGLDNPDGSRGGSVATSGDGMRGLDLRSTDGTVTATLASVTTRGADASAVRVRTGQMDGPATSALVKLDIAAISTDGDGSHGVDVIARNANIKAGSITTKGDAAHGVYVRGDPNEEGVLTVAVDSVTTSGVQSEGVSASGRTTNVTVGDVETTGDGSTGVSATGRAAASVTVQREITTSGTEAAGIYAYVSDERGNDSGPVVINATGAKVSTTGSRSTAVVARGTNVTLTGGSFETAGYQSHGLDLTGSGTVVATELGAVRATGDGAMGVAIHAGGDITLSAQSVETTGAGRDIRTAGVDLASLNGTIDVDIGSVKTAADRGDGIYATTDGDIFIDVNTIETKGRSSAGVRAHAGSNLTLNLGSVTTTGEQAGGVVVGADGVSTVRIATVTTSGSESTGIQVDSATADVTVNSVTTTGARAGGVTVNAEDRAAVTSAVAISTTGERAVGVTAYADGDEGVVDINLNAVRTGGTMAMGVVAAARVVEIAANAITTTGIMADAVSVIDSGDVDLDLGVIRAEGEGSRGVVVAATGLINLEAVSVDTTKGVYSAQSPDAIVLDSSAGEIVANVGTIGTAGYGARGLAATAAGDIGIEVTTITTSGDAAHGIVAAGEAVEIEVGTITTTGAGALAIDADSRGAMEVRATALTGRSTLIDATSGDDMTITLGRGRGAGEGAAVVARSAGDITFNVLNELTSTGGAAADLNAVGALDFTVAQGAVVQGDEVGLKLMSGTGTHLILDGTVSATSGLALDIKGGAATIDNRGNTIVGRVDLTANDDVLDNVGRFTTSGNSDFGAGTDVINNTGLIELAEAAGARSASFLNLERLNNAGTIDLSNGRSGDILNVSGVFNGQTGGTVLMDLDLRGEPSADRIVAGGFEGVTRVMLDVVGSGRIGETGVVIAQSGRAQTGAEVVAEVANGGFVDYSVLLSGNAFVLQGSLAAPAFEPTKIASGAQHQWTSGANVVSSRFEQMRDGGLGEGKGVQIWSQTFDGSVDIDAWRSFDIEGDTVSADLSHEVKSRGLQAGVDRAIGDFAFGLLAGTGRTDLRFENGDRTHFVGMGVGAYGHWGRGPLSVGGVLKLDNFDVDYDWAEAGLRTSADGHTLGLRVDVAWRATAGESWYLEPQASLSWSDTSLESIESDTGTVDFGDTRSMVGRIGVRAGGIMPVADGMALRPYASLNVLNEFKGGNTSRLHLDDQSIQVQDQANDAWARGTLGVSIGSQTGLAGFVQAEQDFGAVEGFTARAGVRYAW